MGSEWAVVTKTTIDKENLGHLGHNFRAERFETCVTTHKKGCFPFLTNLLH